jgi:hypothetical protein
MKQSSSEAVYVSQLLQADFDKMLRNILGKYHHFPGVALVLGAILEHTRVEFPKIQFCNMKIASLLHPMGYLNSTEFSGIMEIYSQTIFRGQEFLNHFVTFLEDPEQSKTHVFDQQRYATASKECLQLCLFNHHRFSKGTMESAHREKELRRSRPSLWGRRLGVHSRIRKSRHHLKVRQHRLIKAQSLMDRSDPPPNKSLEHEYCRRLFYRWALDILPSLLEKSAISLELAEVLRGRTFTMMGQKFPRRMRLAKEAKTKYLLRVKTSRAGRGRKVTC